MDYERKMSFLIQITLQLIIFLSLVINSSGFVNSPKIITKDGNLIFESGLNRNISFRLQGNSRININGDLDILDLLLLSKGGRNSSSTSNGGVEEWNVFEDDAAWQAAASDLNALKLRVFGPNGLDKRLRQLQNRTRNVNQVQRRYQMRLENVETKVQQLTDRLEADNCKNNPCENGGTCFNMFNGFVCKCTKNFEGLTCDKDVNECALFVGTDLGCQNGGQCVNQFGGYNCICTPGWFGIHCMQRKGDCLQASAWELCGHGTCVNSNDNFGFKCICDQGWKTNGLTPSCNVDVDECSGTERHPPCATRCINLPGSFTCAPCGAGLTGSGVNCRDIDECATNNGGCSLSPKVACINSYGSFHCGECPLGWTGDGRSCVRNTNDEGALTQTCAGVNVCHPDAICTEISNTVVCTCPRGMVGSGIGVNGCTRGTAINCNSNPCLNGGTCLDSGSTYQCLCKQGFQQPNCIPIHSPCSTSPCLNNGICRALDGANFQCDCPSGYRGRLCETRFNRCGGILATPTGILRYPDEGSFYAHNSQCAWVIQTNVTQVLNVTFNMFELEDSSECRFDWLQINDGRTAAAQIIGRFCGTHKPLGGNIISSTNYLYLWFRSDNSTTKEGFEITWNSIPPMCGGIIEVDIHGTIASPGSPGNYPKNRDCIWNLRASNTKRIKLTFFSLSIESHDSCNYDYVEITDNISGMLLERYCNSSRPAPLLLPTNEAIIHFHSDNEGTDTGFQLHYSTEPRTPGCGGTYTAKEDTIRSPDVILEPISCEYDIKMAVGESVNIEFLKFDMDEGDCIELYDVEPTKGIHVLQSKYCGGLEARPVLFSSLYNAVQIKFYSKAGKFELKYKADCSYTYESSTDVIISPNYPHLSNSERYCTYKILTEPNTVISLHFDDFEMNDSSLESNDCAYTFLKINDGLNRDILGPFCQNNTPPTDMVSKRNMLMLHIQTGPTSSGKGFKLQYRAVPASKLDCGGVYTKPGLTIRLPTDDDGVYTNNMRCYWIIMAPQHQGILLTWKSFAVEYSTDCTYDYLEIYDNFANSDDDKPLARYCDHHEPPEILSHSNMLTLKFASDFSIGANGFELSYEFIDYNKYCGGNIISSSGKLTSPEWPLNYTNNMECTWTITAPRGTQIQLQIDVFEIEETDQCDKDWLEIRNGASANSSIVGHFCGKKIPNNIPSFTNQMWLRFHSDSFGNARGFQIKWHIYANGCGGKLNADMGTITSPFYPSAYPSNAECEWNVRVNTGSSIHFIIEDLEMEDLYNCNYDSLEIYDGRSIADLHLAKLCSLDNGKQMELITSGNEALVRFTTDGSSNERGFYMSYYANCTRTITDMHGVIESPNYGNSYRLRSINCAWTLKAPKGNSLRVEFTHFDKAKDRGEMYIVDMAKNASKMNIDPKKDLSFNTTGDTLLIVQNYSDVNFRLEYSVVGCINVFHRDSGEFQSPNYPSTYPNDIECFWEIRTALGQGIELTINNMDIEDSANCTHDALQISNHPHSTNYKEKHCGKQDKIVITSSGHRLYMRFYSDGAHNGRGFNATYKTLKSPCGGILESKNGVIQSPNYPLSYPSNANCEWTVKVADYHSIVFSLEELDLEDYYDCEMDYLEATENIDGSGDDGEERKLFKLCGDLPEDSTDYVSMSNVATVNFVSDSSIEKKGFKLSFREKCGKHITVDIDDYGFIELIGGQTNDTCVWHIIAKDTSKHIHFVTTHVQLSTSMSLIYRSEGDCLNNGVKIFDGSDTNAPLRYKFCKSHPEAIISNGHALTVQVPRAIISEFEGSFSILDSICSAVYNSIRGKFSTPYYPSSYPNNIDCEWYIDATPGNSIALTIESMDMEESDDCNHDYVEIRESNNSGRLLGLFCGKTVPPTIEAVSSLWVKFSTDDDVVGEGFLASYSYVLHNELNGTNGKIQSPRYPTKFLSDETYSWRITVERDYVVLLTITHIVDVDIPYIKFYDGYSDIGVIIDYTNSHIIRSNTNVLYLTATHGPFEFEWSQLSKEALRSNQSAAERSELCGKEVLTVNNELVFNSPGYPNGYANNLHCSWTIIPENSAMHVILQFIKIDLEEFSECLVDHVIISSSSDLVNWKQLDSLCKKPDNSLKKYDGTPYLKLEFVTDASVNKTGFSTFTRAVCGSELTDRMGLVNITRLATGIGVFQMDCVWTIRVRQGRRIRITFPESYLTSENDTTPQCRSIFMVRNGIDEDSPFLGKGKYCENNITDVLETSANRAYIKFTRVGFPMFRAAFQYEEIQHECSDEIILHDDIPNEDTKYISSPRYPNLPNPHSECVWRIVAPIHHLIALHFVGDFDLAEEKNEKTNQTTCDREYIQVNDGGTELMPLIVKKCGTTKPDTIYSTGNVLRVKYFTDISEPHAGFMAQVQIGRCGGAYHSSEGVISSPVGFKLLSNEKEYECVYLIEMEQGHTINLTVDRNDLSHGNCLELEEIDMYTTEGTNNITDTLRLCDNVHFGRYIVETNKLIIRFKITERTASTDSFQITYKTIDSRCGETIHASQGILQTPGYPGIVRRPTHCLWRISVPKGRRIKIEFLDFDTGAPGASSNSSSASFGDVTRFRGRITFANDFQMSSIIARVQRDPPSELYSTDNTMAIDAFIFSFSTHRGFKLRFSSQEASQHCRAFIDLDNGGSLQFNRDNDTSVFCNYDLKMRQNETLVLQVDKYRKYAEYLYPQICSFVSPLKLFFQKQEIQEDWLCKNDTQLSVRLPFPVTMQLSGNKRNKLAELELQYKVYGCGGIKSIHYGDNLTIARPELQGYNGRLECAWAVWPNGDFTVDNLEDLEALMEDEQLVIDLATDFTGTCADQYVLIYNGPNQNSPHLGRYCTQSTATNLVVEKGLFFEYVTNSYDTKSSFNLTIKQGSGCGGILKYPFRNIFFEEQYKNNAECVWEIVTDPGFHLGLSFMGRFFIESSADCKKDYLRVEQINLISGEWEHLQTLCGRDPPKSVNTTTTKMRLIFRSDNDTIGDGFTARFERNCGGILFASDELKRTSSPGYPKNYENQLYCNYTILPKNAGSGAGIVLRFLDFDLEDAPVTNCMFDNVTIYSKDYDIVKQEAVLCGYNKTREFHSKKALTVILQTDVSFTYKGFLMEYSNLICGGLITNATIIQSPRHQTESSFPSNSKCSWNLTAPEGYKILIKFEELDFEAQSSCSYDAVEIYKGLLPVTDQRLAKFCGNLTGHLPMLSIPSNTGLLYSFSDESQPSRGFRAAVNFIPNCDSTFHLDLNNLTYVFNTYSGSYANNLDCATVFTTVAGRQLQIAFNSFHVENSTNCQNDFLEIKDGAGPFADVIGVFCGHEIPATLMSSKSALFLRFVTDSLVTSTGFSAEIRSIPLTCGQHNIEVKESEKVELKSPTNGDTGKYQPNLNCFWKLKSEFNIHLQFEKLDLQAPNANGTCESDTLKIYSREDADYIEKGYGSTVVFNGHNRVNDFYNFAEEHIYCGTGVPDDYFSTSKELYVKFKTDNAIESSGFKIIASAAVGCFRNFTGTQGRVLLAETADHCDVYITAPQNYSLSIHYSEVQYSEYDCEKEYIEVFETKTNTSLKKDCHYVPSGTSVFSTHNQLRLRLKMDNVYTQFDFTYLASTNGPGCGGNLYNTVGIFTSPFYPNSVREASDCRWNIRVPSNLHVLLRFEIFDLGAKSTCHSDYLQIIERNADGNDVVVRQFCGGDEPKVYKSDKSSLAVRFHKTVNYDGTGWVLRFSGVYANYKIPEYYYS